MSPESSAAPRHRTNLRSWLEFSLYRSLESCLSRLPLTWSYRITETVLRLIFILIPRFKARTLKNLDIAYGNSLTAGEKAQLFSGYLNYVSWFFTDMILSPLLLKNPHHLAGVDCGEAIAALNYLGAKSETGVLVVSSHQGAPDVMVLTLGLHGWPIHAVARELDNPKLNEHLNGKRTAFDCSRLPKHGALLPARRILKNKGLVGMQIDQDAGKSGIFVPYFGKLASTNSGAATLAILTGVPVVVFHCIRTKPRKFEFKVFAELVELPSQDMPRDLQILDLTVRMTNAIEVMARRYPEQVFWGHRRWKTQCVKCEDPAPAQVEAEGRLQYR